MDIIVFLIGFGIGLTICYSIYFYIESKLQEKEWRDFKRYMREQKERVIRDSDGEIIWRGDVGICGKAARI